MAVRDPVSAFLRRWLHRNYPRHRDRAVFLTYDAFQFMFEKGRITGLLDFELACVGDPMMDLAALRVRDTIKNLGDLSVIAQGFEGATGIGIDLDAVDYHTVMYNTLTVLSAGPPMVAPERTTDYVSHLAWYVNSARWAFEVIAEMCGFALEPVDVPGPQASRHAPSYGHLVEALRARSVESPPTTKRSRCIATPVIYVVSMRSANSSWTPISTTCRRCWVDGSPPWVQTRSWSSSSTAPMRGTTRG